MVWRQGGSWILRAQWFVGLHMEPVSILTMRLLFRFGIVFLFAFPLCLWIPLPKVIYVLGDSIMKGLRITGENETNIENWKKGYINGPMMKLHYNIK